MIRIHTLPLGDYQTNCYIVHADDRTDCCVIDPGYEADTIVAALKRFSRTPAAILLTHGHFDHVGAVRSLAEKFGCPVYIRQEELSLPEFITGGPLYYTHTYPESGTLNIAGLAIRVLPTPGHTPGSVCLIAEDAMFSGDTLFADSCGRTDLPGGSQMQIFASLKTLAQLPGDYRVFPGHGEATTLEQERRTNYYMPR